MLRNLTNFASILAKGRFKTRLESTDVLAIGTKQSRSKADYKPTAIKFSDLQAQLGGGGGSISLTTVGNSGAATLVGSTLNVPNYAGGLEGSNYVYVAANSTDIENAAELQAAYNEAKTKVQEITKLSNNLIQTVFFGNPKTISNTFNFFNYDDLLPMPIPLGVQNVEVISNELTGTIEIDVINSNNFSLVFTYSGTTLNNVTSFRYVEIEVQRATVIAAPSYYNFATDFVMDTEYVDLVSLDGNRSIIFSGVGAISITANDVFVKGVDVQDKPFTIATNLNLLKVENCQGGDNSFFGGFDTLSGTFTNCIGGNNSFNGNTVSGIFTDCQGGDESFGYQGTAIGTFIRCISSERSFGTNGTASGTFTDCKSECCSFARFGLASGIFTNCVGTLLCFGGQGTASGTFTNCKGDGSDFGGQGTASGTFNNCIGGFNSFGGSFGGILSGKLYYCRLTLGNFQTVSGAGITRLCLAGNNAQNNQG